MQKRFTLLASLFLFVSISLMAQLSDEQVVNEAKRYQESGMSDTQIFQELSKKGVTPVQFQRIKEQLDNKQSAGSKSSTSTESNRGIRADDFDAELYSRSMEEIPQDTIPQQERVYGYDFFSRPNLTFAPNMNMPTPANYVLGPGDEILIDVWGDSELSLRNTITPDGYIAVSGMGRIQISGMSVEQATSRIKREFSEIYSDLYSEDPHTFLGVSVGNTRTIKVNVMGEVVQPGTYTLTSFASAFHALYAAGGPSKIGSLRSIEVFRGGKSIEKIDLYEYLMNGDSMVDITLRDGDIIKVNTFGILAQIVGQIKRPMKYEMLPNETLNDLIRFAGGFSGNAYKNNLLVDRMGEIGMESYTIDAANYGIFGLHDGDSVQVGSILEKFSNAVQITGAVNRPGKYAIGEGVTTLKDLVTIAQGTTGDAFLDRALLYREKDDLTTTVESINLIDLINNRIPDITLRKNDNLYVPSANSLRDTYTVYVGGEVSNPGTFSYADNLSIEDIILRAGGLRESASTARVDVYRRIKDPASKNTSDITSEIFTFSLENGLMTTQVKDFVLEPFDQVVVRKSPSYEVQQNVSVNGEVLFTGEYAKEKKDERLSSIIARSGGLTDYAYIEGARLSRKLTPDEIKRTRESLEHRARISADSSFIDELDFTTQYVGIDLAKAMKNPGGPDDIILRDGDVLNIPTYSGTVKISGGVLYPNTVTYTKGMQLRDYIKQAGGYSRLAMKSKPYVVYMNGKVATGKWVKIEPGCEIVVPEKPEREPMSIQGIVGITTSIATMAALILNLVK